MVVLIARVALLWLVAFSAAAWGEALSPAQRAQAAFDKVDWAPVPKAQDCLECMQAHAALLPLVKPEQRYLAYYRRGYCALMSAAVSREAADYQEAAGDFNRARENWPGSVHPSSGLLAILGVARTGTAAVPPPKVLPLFEEAAQKGDCSFATLMQESFCRELVDVARLWTGVAAYRGEKPADAFHLLNAVTGSPWKTWAAGRQVLAERRWSEAASLLREAVVAWRQTESGVSPRTVDLLGPRPDMAEVSQEWALAEFRNENYAGAVAATQAAIQHGSKNPYTRFIQARSEDQLGQAANAIADYVRSTEMAAEAHDAGWAVGQAHYYRGILLFRAGKYREAAEAFGAAPGGGLGEILPQDAAAWGDLALLASGDCTKAARFEQAAGYPANGFPTSQAQTLRVGCRIKKAATLEQLLDLEREAGHLLPLGRLKELKGRIADAYSAQGVAAEDRKDLVTALIAYRNALDWNAASSKARFNLAAIYLEQKNYLEAETQYRMLSELDPADYEAQYWLAEAILAQPMTPVRKHEACELLKRSLAVADSGKRENFQKTLVSVNCR